MASKFSVDDFWEHLVPQSHYRQQQMMSDDQKESRGLDLTFSSWKSLPDSEKKALCEQVVALDNTITLSLLDDRMMVLAKQDGHLAHILKSLGL